MYYSKQSASVTYRKHLHTVFKSIVIASVAFIGLGSNASAGITQYTIDGAFDTGNLAGLGYLEVFTFDDASKPSVPGTVPWTTPLLSYSLTVDSLSKHWTLADWPMAHTFSQWVDANGILNSRTYLATPGPTGSPPAVSEFLDDGMQHFGKKHVKWYDWPRWNTIQTDSTDYNPIVTVVPEPSSVLLLLIGLIGVIAIGLRHKRC